jgi:gliding motility-associated-like protein
MKFFAFFIALFITVCTANAQLIINEFSQGANGAQEYIELVVVGHKSCSGDSCADIRGWIVDDNNGWYGAASSQGIAPGHIRFSDVNSWSCVPYGSIILIYNNGDKNPEITLPNDPYDSNNDHVYVLPSNSPLMQGTVGTPLSPSSTTYVYPTSTTYVSNPAWGAIGLANTGDAVIVVDPTAPSVAYHSIAYGNLTSGTNATIFKSASGGALNYYLNNDQYTSSAAYNVGNAPANETPGMPNSPANAAWISDMLTTVVGTADYDVYACTAPNVPYNFNGTMLSNSGVYVDTMNSTFGCDSIIHLHLSVVTPINTTGQITSCQPVTFNGITYPVSTVVNDTFLSTLGCDSVYMQMTINIQTIITTQQWDTLSGCQLVIYNGNTYTFTQQINDTIKTAAGCDSVYKHVYLKVLPIPQIGVPNNFTICKGDAATLTAIGSGPIIWDGYPQGTTINIKPDSTTKYTVRTTNELNCEGVASVTVFLEDFILSLNASTTQAEIGVPVLLTASSAQNFNTMSWTPEDKFPNYHASQQSVIFYQKGDVAITVAGESENSCKDTASLTIHVLQAPDVFIPSAFSPNGDGLNDYFKPQFIRDYTIRNFSIFNRYGQRVYSISLTKQIGNGWDGSFNGKSCDKGTYYYILSLQDPLGKETIMKGDVALVN